MSILLIDAESIVPQAWRNGGGRTRELLVRPATGDWMLRISRADIDTDGPFSAFPRVERWFAVMNGAGVALSFAGAEHEIKSGDAPLRFDGAAAPGCRLLDGPTQDLNLMLRNGAGAMRPVQAGRNWDEAFSMRGLYAAEAGRWSDGAQTRTLAAHTLLWIEAGGTGPWMFEPAGQRAPCSAWWLGFTAKE